LVRPGDSECTAFNAKIRIKSGVFGCYLTVWRQALDNVQGYECRIKMKRSGEIANKKPPEARKNLAKMGSSKAENEKNAAIFC
jgi:hypothetical protein